MHRRVFVKLAAATMSLVPAMSYAAESGERKRTVTAFFELRCPLRSSFCASMESLYPYGYVMSSDGHMHAAGAYDEDEHPVSQHVIDLLESGFTMQAKAHQSRACAIVYDARVTSPKSEQLSDAIAVRLAHRDHYAVTVFVPYIRNASEVRTQQRFVRQEELSQSPFASASDSSRRHGRRRFVIVAHTFSGR